MRILIVIRTYDRPQELESLIGSILASSNLVDDLEELKLLLIDDNSKKDYLNIKNLCNKYNWKYIKNKINYGKEKAWINTNNIYQEIKKENFDYLFYLPDDIIVSKNFINDIISIWKSIKDNKKIILTFHHDSSRSPNAIPQKCWTNIEPVFKNNLWINGWVDEMYFCERNFFDILNWKINDVGNERFKDKNISSGIGSQISKRLAGKYHIYLTKYSYVYAIDIPSKMNEIERKKTNLFTVDFIDGNNDKK